MGARKALFLGILVLGCGTKGSGFDDGGGTDMEAGMDLDASLNQGDSTMQGMCGANDPITCSGDLHSVLCNGNVMQTCPPDQGCANGMCIPACDAAVANKSTIGCEYYPHNPIMVFGNGCFALFVANTWNADITLKGDAGGKTIDLTKYAYLPKGTGANLQFTPVGSK